MIHSQKERRYRCKRCGRTFSTTKGTALYRTHKLRDPLTTPRRDLDRLRVPGAGHRRRLLSLSLDERTIHRWQLMSGQQCRLLHERIVQAGGVPLAQVQADELRVRGVGGVVWLAPAISVTSRLWLGGAVCVRRDRRLMRTLLEGVRACGAFEPFCFAPTGFRATPSRL